MATQNLPAAASGKHLLAAGRVRGKRHSTQRSHPSHAKAQQQEQPHPAAKTATAQLQCHSQALLPASASPAAKITPPQGLARARLGSFTSELLQLRATHSSLCRAGGEGAGRVSPPVPLLTCPTWVAMGSPGARSTSTRHPTLPETLRLLLRELEPPRGWLCLLSPSCQHGKHLPASLRFRQGDIAICCLLLGRTRQLASVTRVWPSSSSETAQGQRPRHQLLTELPAQGAQGSRASSQPGATALSC